MNKFLLQIISCASFFLPCVLHAEETLSIIKPDAVKNQHIGEIVTRFEKNGLKIAAMKMIKLSPEKAASFYSEHQGKPFFDDLTHFMTSGPVIVMVLSGQEAITKNRTLMGATDLNKADIGTLRKDFAKSITENAVHGSDSPESARKEIAFFFSPEEILNQ